MQRILIILVVVFVAAFYFSWQSDEELEKSVDDRMVNDHLAVLDAWVTAGRTKSDRHEIAESCEMLLYVLSDDEDFEIDDSHLEKLYFCQEITAARVNMTSDEFRKIQQDCTEKDDSFHRLLCRHSGF